MPRRFTEAGWPVAQLSRTISKNNMVSVETPQSAKAPGIKKVSLVPRISFFKRGHLNSNDDKTPDRSSLLSSHPLKLLVKTENLEELKTVLEKLGVTILPPDVYELVRNSLDAIKEEVNQEILIGKTVLGSAIATTVGLSAGYVVLVAQRRIAAGLRAFFVACLATRRSPGYPGG